MSTSLPPPRSAVPVITTSVPTCPDDGSTDAISPAVMYVHAPSLVVADPVSETTTTCPVPTLPSAAAISTKVSFASPVTVATSLASMT